MSKSGEIAHTFIIFGATGDLATKKLFPALFALYIKGKLPQRFSILALSRRNWKDINFRSYMRAKMPVQEKEFSADFANFLNQIFYSEVLFDENKGYFELHDRLHEIDTLLGMKSKKIFYMSLAPSFYENVFNWLGAAKIFEERSSRLLIEKPFGTSELSADKLHKILREHLHEKQIFFVDHYLGKDTLRAVRSLHSTTKDFDRILTNKNVEYIKLRIFETHGIEMRGISYDAVGAFRDIAQNHMMVMLSTVASPCRGMFKNSCQHVRANAIASLGLIEDGAWSRNGQYSGYLEEEGVSKQSRTETAFTFNTFFKKGPLKGVKVLFEGGKGLEKAFASVEIALKDDEKVIINIQPEQSIVVISKEGTDTISIEKKGDAYEHIFVASMVDDTRMFASFEEIKASWKITDSVISSWDGVEPVIYSKDKPFIV